MILINAKKYNEHLLNYFKHFFPNYIMEQSSFHTNNRYVEQRAKSLKVTSIEIIIFVGV